jgi:hypothetical protein
MAYSTIPKGSLHMNPKLYTGNGSTNAITGVGFQPDWVWIKKRNGTTSHVLTDIVRGITKQIYSNDSQAENTNSDTITAIGSDGFTLGNRADVNNNSDTYVAWNWKANGQGSANTDGSINTTYTSVNTTAKFSISKYTGNASSGATIGHGLGSVPKMIMVKNLSIASNWLVYNYSMSANGDYALFLDSYSVKDNSQDYWGDTTPTSSVFSVGARQEANGSGNSMIAYCFSDVQGYSKSGIYTGNGNADGTFVYLGFKPAFVMIKATGLSENWWIMDSKRSTSNVVQNLLQANLSAAEVVGNANIYSDMLSNGFKLRGSDGAFNSSGQNYIYMAFAENPFVATSGTNAIPVTAR